MRGGGSARGGSPQRRPRAIADRALDVGDSPLPWTPTSEAMVPFEAAMRSEMLAASALDSTFLPPAPAPGGDGAGGARASFDMDAHVGVAAKLVAADEALSRARYRLVPRRVTEVEFWRNYFEAVGRIRAVYRARANAALDARAASADAAAAATSGGGDGAGAAAPAAVAAAQSVSGTDGAGGAASGGVTAAVPPTPPSAACSPRGSERPRDRAGAPEAGRDAGGAAVGTSAAVQPPALGAASSDVPAIAGVPGAAEAEDGGADFVFVDGGHVDEAVFEAALARALTADEALDAPGAGDMPDDGACASGRSRERARR